MNLLITNGRVIDPSQRLDAKADIAIEDGLIAGVGKKLRTTGETIDAAGLVIVPGFIDLHTHLRAPGQEHKETIAVPIITASDASAIASTVPSTRPVAGAGRALTAPRWSSGGGRGCRGALRTAAGCSTHAPAG